jgi:AraC family transcriptional regulator
MPQLRWYDGGTLTVADWHCPGAALGTGREEVAPAFEVSIGRAGSHAIRGGDGETLVEPTHLLCMNAGEVFRPVRRALGVDRRTRITVDADVLPELVGADRREQRFPARTVVLTARGALAHHQLLRAVTADCRDELAIHALALELVAAAGNHAPPRPRPASTVAVRAAVRAAQELLARHFAEPTTLAALAADVGLSPWHLSRHFRREVGLGAHQYRTRLRLLAALDRIRDSQRPDLARIAFEVGFSSHSHLSREFRAFFGVPPSRINPRRASATARGA